MLTRTLFLGYLIHRAPLFAIILSIIAGTMLSRVMRTDEALKKVLKSGKFYEHILEKPYFFVLNKA